MKYEEFKGFLEAYQKMNNDLSKLDELGFNFYEGKFKLSEHAEKMLDLWCKSNYTEIGVEWINWFIFDNEFGKNKLKAKDGRRLICQDLKGLFDYVKQYEL